MIIPLLAAQVNLKWSGTGLPHGGQTTFGIACPDADDPEDIRSVIAPLLVSAKFVFGLSNMVRISGMLIKMGPNETGAMGEYGLNVVGNDVGQACPPNTSVLVRKNTVAGGRRAQGRWFIPGVPESASDGTGALTSAAQGEYELNWNNFRTGLATAGMPMLLLHSAEHEGDLPLAITKLSVSSTLATQRRRLRG